MLANCHLIYTGGTFGSHGVPLNTLPAGTFLPAFLSYYPTLIPIDNPLVKDSSAFSPQDFLALYTLIKQAQDNGAQQFILISGTDTLAYLAAFLSYALAGRSLTLVLVASMRPFFVATAATLTKDNASDAYTNFNQALDFFATKKTGVFVSTDGNCYHGCNLQKIHSHESPAFVGENIDSRSPPQLASHAPMLDSVFAIHSLYCLPNDPKALADQLSPLVHRPPSAVILIGFGAGNLPHSEALADILKTLKQRHFLLIMTSACPFGGVSGAYDAGAWVYRLGVQSDGHATIATLYAKALWLCLTNLPTERHAKWDMQ